MGSPTVSSARANLTFAYTQKQVLWKTTRTFGGRRGSATPALLANDFSSTVSVIRTSDNTLLITVTLPGGSAPTGIAISPDGSRVYVVNNNSSTVSVIRTSDNTLLTPVTLPAGSNSYGIAVAPDGSRVYVANQSNNTVSVIRTSDNTLLSPVNLPAGSAPVGIAVTPDGTRVYVANQSSSTVSVIRTSDNTLLTPVTLPAGSGPQAFGQFIGPAAAPPPAPVPTLSEWAMILFGLILAGGAALYIQRRHQAI